MMDRIADTVEHRSNARASLSVSFPDEGGHASRFNRRICHRGAVSESPRSIRDEFPLLLIRALFPKDLSVLRTRDDTLSLYTV